MSQVVISKSGPLPITMQVNWPSSEALLVAVSGSAWTATADTTLAVKLTIHATGIGTLQHFANAASTHFAFPTAFFNIDGDIGPTTIELTAGNGTTVTDQNDHFTVALIY